MFGGLTPTDEHRQRYEKRLEEESEQRRAQYRLLAQWADWRHRQLVRRKSALLVEDEREFEQNVRLTDPRTFEFEPLYRQKIGLRSVLSAAITLYDVERMVYELLEDPEWTLNTSYITLEDDNDKAAREEEDFLAQAEMLRVINDNFLMKFAPLTPRDIVRTRGDKPLDVLRRVAEQENVSRWIKRLALRGEYERAVDFADTVQGYINDPQLFMKLSLESREPKAQEDETDDTVTEYIDRSFESIDYVWASWRHTVVMAERIIWRNVAAIRQGHAGVAIREIEALMPALRDLYWYRRTKPIKIDGRAKEYGFRANPDAEEPALRYDHPGRARLKRLLSHAHNVLGYANSRRGDFLSAIDHYTKGLAYIQTERDLLRPSRTPALSPRREKALMPAHRAKLINNTARAHSEIGNPATAMCLDGLALRRDLAEEVPLAASLNTLALIYSHLGRYEDAPLLSAKAVAYCRRAGESRQQALALRQLAESLRHLAERTGTGQRVAVPPEDYFATAETLLHEARGLFVGAKEADRQPEVELEMGSLARVRMDYRLRAIERDETGRLPYAHDPEFEDFRRTANERLGLALDTARPDKPHLVLEAHGNLARVHALAERYHRRLAAAAHLDPTGRADAGRETAAADEARRRADQALNHLMAEAGERKIDLKEDSDETLAGLLPRIIRADYQPDNAERRGLRNQAWIFLRLSRAWLLRGALALDDFEQAISRIKATAGAKDDYTDVVRKATDKLTGATVEGNEETCDRAIERAFADEGPEDSGHAAAQTAAQTAEAFALALRHAELFSPGSRMVAGTQNAFYNRARKFNPDELALLDQAFLLVGRSAPYNGRVATFTLLRDFLPQYFGYGRLNEPAGDEGGDHD